LLACFLVKQQQQLQLLFVEMLVLLLLLLILKLVLSGRLAVLVRFFFEYLMLRLVAVTTGELPHLLLVAFSIEPVSKYFSSQSRLNDHKSSLADCS
jgi:hypothetical protein